ncbi:hypothetical protein O6P43_017075 [Quillaja saponaria]|uniref:Uncharacterized protein n=1 Tax=Quillaja saponaria TaxID=32244 RepID=A0AAD7PNJ5_QUISA|nr:hypothetical protein O6P43_017075 [Quillaja saponaria]
MTSATTIRGLKNRMSFESFGEYYKETGGDGNVNGTVDVYGRIDEWMRDSVEEIVALLCFARIFTTLCFDSLLSRNGYFSFIISFNFMILHLWSSLIHNILYIIGFL